MWIPKKKKKKYLGIILKYLGSLGAALPSGRVSSPSSAMVQDVWPRPAVPVTGQVDFT